MEDLHFVERKVLIKILCSVPNLTSDTPVPISKFHFTLI